MVFERGQVDNEQRAHHLLYHLAEEQGKEKTFDEIKLATKQKNKIPLDYHEMLTQMKCFKGLCSILLGKENFITARYQDLISLVELHKHIFLMGVANILCCFPLCY